MKPRLFAHTDVGRAVLTAADGTWEVQGRHCAPEGEYLHGCTWNESAGARKGTIF